MASAQGAGRVYHPDLCATRHVVTQCLPQTLPQSNLTNFKFPSAQGSAKSVTNTDLDQLSSALKLLVLLRRRRRLAAPGAAAAFCSGALV